MCYVKMTLEDFNQLSESEKIMILGKSGAYLKHLDILEQTFILFRLWDFHVEVWYDPEREEVGSLRSFNNSQGLDPYLDAV